MVILLLRIYPKELKTEARTDIWTAVFIVALFTIAKGRKKFKCPSMDEKINQIW